MKTCCKVFVRATLVAFTLFVLTTATQAQETPYDGGLTPIDNSTEIEEEAIETDDQQEAEQETTEPSPAGNTAETDEDVFEMESLRVIERVRMNMEAGRTEIPREMIRNLPKGNENVTDLLRIAPGVQFDENFRTSENAGEIAPAEISISGGRFYENLFMLDGMSNSNLLDPAAKDPYSKDHVYSHSQKFFIDSWLVEDIIVFDSNISAAYEGFTGGVIDVKTKLPENEFGGKLSYRRTSSSWVHYFDDSESFVNTGSGSSQPKFEKNFYSAALNIPISTNTGLIASYKRNESTIPVEYFNSWKDNERVNETYFLKGVHNINGSTYVDATVSYAPSRNTYFLENVKDSEFDINSGGYFASTNFHRESGGGGSIDIHASYSHSENSRTSPDDMIAWLASKTKPWGAMDVDPDELALSKEGGYGSIDEEGRNFELSLTHKLEPIDFMGEHNLQYGLIYGNNMGRYHRLTDSKSYDGVSPYIDVICRGDATCVDGEQYLTRRTVSPASDVSATVNTLSAYLENSWIISRYLNLRAGARVTTDDYMKNTNLSPRIQAQYDILGNQFTVITAGYSRYYSASLLANKMREGMLPTYIERRWTYLNIIQPWELSDEGTKVTYNFTELDTPYSDEYMIGITQDIYGSKLNVKYVERRGRKEFAQERYEVPLDPAIYYRLNNNGRSEYRSVQVSWSKAWQNHSVMVNSTWQESKTSNDNYNTSLGLEELERIVILNGKEIKRYELPRDNFNRPVYINLAYTGKYFEHFIVGVMARYQTSFKQLEVVDSNYFLGYDEIDPVTGVRNRITTTAYETVEYGDSFMVDCSFSWVQPLMWGHQLTLTLEVDNIFNIRNRTGSNNSYQLGRQFWAGIDYVF